MGLGLGLLGGALGGIAGGLIPSRKADFTNPDFINRFTGPLGTSTRTGFTFSQDPARQAAVDAANQRLSGLLSQIAQGPSKATETKFRDAFLAPRQARLNQQLKQQKQNLNANIAGQGLGGGSAALFAQGQQGVNANQQRNDLFNQAVFGGQQQADRNLSQLINQFSLNQGLSQQDINNRLAAFGQTQGAFNNQNNFELQKAGFMNKLAQARASQSQNRLQDIFGGITAGAGLGDLLGGAKQSSFEGLFNLFGGPPGV